MLRHGPVAPSPQPLRPSVTARPAAWAVVAVVMALAGGCVTQPVNEITLSGIVRGSQAVRGTAPSGSVSLMRDNAMQPAAADTVLRVGDELWTGADASAVVSFPGGGRAYLRPGTHVRIGSLFLDFGKVFVKVKGAFRVSTVFVTAASEGTEYWVEARPGGWVATTVVEGRVRFASVAGAWPSRLLAPGEYALVRGNGPPQQAAADPADMQRENDWVKSMDRLVPPKTGLSPWAVGAGAAAIGAAILLGGGGGGGGEPPRTSDGRPSSTQPGTPTTRTPQRSPRATPD